MKFFSKRKDKYKIEEEFSTFTIESSIENSEKNYHAPNVLTPEEILGMNRKTEDNILESKESESALEALRKKVVVTEEQTEPVKEEAEETAEKEPEAEEDQIDISIFASNSIDEMISSLGGPTEKKEEKTEDASVFEVTDDNTDEITFEFAEEEENGFNFQKEVELSEEKQNKEPVAEPQSINNDVLEELKNTSLFDKCQPYIVDENGQETIEEKPLYKLQSVAEILKNDSEKVLERLSENYDITFDDLGYGEVKTEESPKPLEEPAIKLEAEKPTKKPHGLFVTEKEVFEDKMPVKNQVKNVQSNVASIISDIDIPDISFEEPVNNDISNTATITFTPVSDGSSSGSHITVSTQTRPIDLTGELAKLPSTDSQIAEEKLKLEKNEFEDYIPEREILDEKDAKKFIREFSVRRRRAFLQTVISIFFTLILSAAKLPFLSEFLLSYTTTGMIVCSSIMGIIILCNYDMFISLPKIFSNKASPDSVSSVAALITVVYAIFGIIAGNIITDMLILLSFILSFRALSHFFRFSYMASNLRIVTQNGQRRALRLIDDNAVAMAMAKNSIEGEILISAPQKAEFFEDYMKYSTFGYTLDGKLKLISMVSLILSLAVGLTCGFYFDGAVYGLYAAAAIQCFASLPTLFFIDNLPLYRTAKKLNRKGAMICGKAAAISIEKANAAVLSASDIFPSGTVTLHQMQVLSDNNLEDTIIRAASLTESLNSPLTPIFKKIAGTGNITVFPDSDTVKYEDKMGISGWVDNRLLFIGNRTLMEAHGIEVPPVEVDRKILTQGFFPVYVATRDKACALLVIQYNVDMGIAAELRRMTNSGVTLLVNSSDPNLTEEMISDYFGIYSDTVKVMTAAGCHMYTNTVTPTKKISAPAAFRSNPIALISIINCASKIKRSNLLLTIVYLICAALGAVIFAYTSLGGSGTLISETTLLIYSLASTVVSYLAYLIERP